MLPPALQERLSAKEVEYFAGYDKLLSKYMQHYPGLDLPGAAQVGDSGIGGSGWGEVCGGFGRSRAASCFGWGG